MTSLRVALILVALGGGVPSARQIEQGRRPVAIIHVNVIDAAAGTVAADMSVVIQDGRIVSVAKGAVPRDARIVDGQNKFLIAGFATSSASMRSWCAADC